jgi:hypothetical protein
MLSMGTHKVQVVAKNECGEDTQTIEISVAVPCIVPEIKLTAKEIANSNYTHELNGLITNLKLKSQISVTVNGKVDDTFEYSPTTNKFNLKVKLEPGNSKIRITAKNECGEDVVNFELSVAVPCIVPEIKLTAKEIANSNYTHELNGLITNMKLKTQVSVTVNGTINNTFDFVPTTGSFNLKLKLEPGNSKIRITAKNECGEDVENFELSVAVPCIVPEIKLTAKEIANSNYTHELNGLITNMKLKTQVSVTVNGTINNTFDFVPTTGSFNLKLKLEPGNSKIRITAKNECGEDVENFEFSVAVPCIVPEIKLTAKEIANSNYTHELNGLITNLKLKSQISVTVNGKVDDTFEYSPTTNNFNLKVKLEPGNSKIRITAKNECGEDVENFELSVAVPCIVPEIKLTAKEIANSNYTHELNGLITNMKLKTQVSVTVNGTINNTFDFVPTTGSFNLKLKLEPGNSKIRITAKNECGEDVENFELTVAVPCIVPEIKLTAKEIANSNYTHELNGLITNMKLKTQVSVTVNGAINNTFDFVPTTGSFNLKLKLEPGNSKIRITAKNECGEDVVNFEFSVAVPCVVPKIQLTAKEIANSNYTHELNGLITNMKLKTQVSVTVNGAINNTFDFVPTTGSFNLKLKLEPGNSKIRITAKNECGEDVENFELSVAVPCVVPKIQLTAKEIANSNYTHELNGLITNMKLKTQVSVTVNGTINNTFDFVPTTGSFNLKLKLEPGNSKIRITAKNECGEDVENFELSVAVPCVVPEIKLTAKEIANSNYTHELNGLITNMKLKTQVSVTVNGTSKIINNTFKILCQQQVVSI